MKKDEGDKDRGKEIRQAPGCMYDFDEDQGGLELNRGGNREHQQITRQIRILPSEVVESRIARRRVHPSWIHFGRTGGAFLSWCAIISVSVSSMFGPMWVGQTSSKSSNLSLQFSQ